MSRPPSYRIIRRAYADGREEFRVRLGGIMAWWLAVDTSWGQLDKVWSSGKPHVFRNRDDAEEACHKHWNKWVSKQQIITDETHFDPESP